MDAASIVAFLGLLVPDAALEAAPPTDQPTVFVPRERLLDVCRALQAAPGLRFSFLAEVTAVDWWPREPRFEIVYHLASLGTEAPDVAPKRLRLKVRVADHDARVPTLSPIWPSAGWPEREVWDLFGIVFEGHPDLRRLLMPDDWEGHPLRKDYPVQINLPARAAEPLQITEEEFRANIAADRLRRV